MLIPNPFPMVLPAPIDLTAALQPLVWALPLLLLVSALAIAASAAAPRWGAGLCGAERAVRRMPGRPALGHSAPGC